MNFDKIIERLLKTKRAFIEDDCLYDKAAIAFFFTFIIPFLISIYIIAVVLPQKYVTLSPNYVRIMILFMVLSGILGYFIVRRTIAGIVDIINRVKDIAGGNIKEKIRVIHRDELRDLANAFNKVTADLENKIKELEYSRNLTRELFQKIGHAITSAQKMEALLAIIVQSTRKVLRSDVGFIAVYDHKDKKLRLKAYSGHQKDMVEDSELSDKEGAIGAVIRSSKAVVVKNVNPVSGTPYGKEKLHYNNLLCAPIISKNKIVGVVGIADQKDIEKIETEDLFLLESIASQIATSVENFELNKDMEENYYQTLLALARVIEAKDSYGEGHLERVKAYVEKMAEKLKLSDEARKILSGGAILHDLGKVGIQDSILKKEGELTKEEYEIIKQHSVIGENILKPLRSMSKLATLVRHHHELYDGTGYPDGLKGEEIPFLSRILTIVDIYDAISTARRYRKAMAKEDAMATLKGYGGTKLDPHLVEAFLDIVKSEKS